MPPAAAIAGRALNWARPVLASAPVQKVLRRLADRSTGPSEEELRAGRSRFWGEVSNAAGKHRTARLETANGYRLTADGTIMAVKFLLGGLGRIRRGIGLKLGPSTRPSGNSMTTLAGGARAPGHLDSLDAWTSQRPKSSVTALVSLTAFSGK
jgi:hypothetical protein